MAEEKKKVIIIGAGLVGSMAAVHFAKHGFTVEIFEARSGFFFSLSFFFSFFPLFFLSSVPYLQINKT